MQITSHYTLTKTEGKLAFFHATQKYTLTNSYEKIQLDASGTGEGSMIVDSQKNYLTSNLSIVELIFKIKAADLTMNMTQIATVVHKLSLYDN